MPRVDGEFVAPFPPVVPDTTIESAVHNGIVADFVADANAPRPITAGGTGAVSAAAARTNLQAERSMQTVTNYDSHVWENGSFWSAAGATGAPEPSGTYGGICVVINNDLDYIIIEATEASLGGVYVRRKYVGVWGAWTIAGASQYVDVAGDTMSGTLTVPAVFFNDNNRIVSDGVSFFIRTQGEVYLQQVSGAVPPPINIGAPTLDNHATTKYYVDIADGVRVLKAGDTMSGYLTIPTISPTDPGHALYAANRDYVNTYVSSQFAAGITVEGLTATGGYIDVNALSGGNAHLRLQDDGGTTKGYFYWERSTDTLIIQASAGTQYLFNNAGAYKAGGGSWSASSDARVKTVNGDYEHGLAEILQLQPVRYTYTASEVAEPTGEREFIGLVAQDVEGVMPELVTQSAGTINGQPVTDLRNLDVSPLIHALINAVKTLSARLAVLEGAGTARNR